MLMSLLRTCSIPSPCVMVTRGCRLGYVQSDSSSIQHSALPGVGFQLILLKTEFTIFYSIKSYGRGETTLVAFNYKVILLVLK